MNIKELENKVKNLKERRERLKKYVNDNKDKPEMFDLVNIAKGQSIELLSWISYVMGLIKELKGE